VILGASGVHGGCAARDADPSLDHADLHPVLLRSTLLSEAAAVGIPARLQVADGVLWVGDAGRNPPYLHALDTSTGALLQSFGKRGEGPGDFAGSPFALGLDSGDGRAIWAFDGRLQRLTRFEPRPTADYELLLIHLEGPPRAQRVVRAGAGGFIGVTQSVEARFALYAADGTRVGATAGRLNGPDDAPQRWRWAATNGAISVCAWPGRGFVIANHGFGRLELYDMEARWVRDADVPFPSAPTFDDQGRYLIRAGYLNCTATLDHVYALFPGQNAAPSPSPDELKDMRAQSGTFVHVFDWEGELRAVFQLDRDAGAITISRAGDVLYASSFIDSGIYRFKVPSLLGESEPWKERDN
jgi:hypothetical protein